MRSYFCALALGGLFSSQFAAAADFTFFCQSSDWQKIRGFDEAYMISLTSKVTARTQNEAQAKADEICSTWAKHYGIASAKSTTCAEHSRCASENQGLIQKFKIAKINSIKGSLNEFWGPRGTGLGFSTLFVDNANREKPIMNADGKEQAQWISVGEERFCGKFSSDFAFLKLPDGFKVIRLSTKEQGFYRYDPRSTADSYFVETPISGIDAEYLGWYIYPTDGSNILFYNRNGDDITSVKAVSMFYIEANSRPLYAVPECH